MSQPTLVQHVASGMDAIDPLIFQFTLPNKTGANNLLVIGIQHKTQSGFSIGSITDDQGNTWTQVTSESSGSPYFQTIEVWQAHNIASGTQVISVNFSGGGGAGSYSGTQGNLTEFAYAGTVDVFHGSGSSISSGSLTPTINSDLIYYYAVDMQSFYDPRNDTGGSFNSTTLIQPPTNFTLLSADNMVGAISAYYVQPTAGAINPGATVGGSKQWGSIAVAFLYNSSGTLPTASPRIIRTQSFLVGSLETTDGPILSSYQFPCSGDTLVATWNGPDAQINSISDSNSNSWSQAVLENTQYIAQIYYAKSATTSNTFKLSLTLNNGNQTFQSILKLYDVIGLDQTAPLTNVNTANGNASSAGNFTSVGITPTTAGGIVFAVCAIDTGTILNSSPSGAGYIFDGVVNTQDNDQVGGGSSTPNSPLDEDNGYAHVYNSGTSALSFKWAMTFNTSAAQLWGAAAAAFKPAVAGPAPTAPVVAISVN